jgi:hypothetical protein
MEISANIRSSSNVEAVMKEGIKRCFVDLLLRGLRKQPRTGWLLSGDHFAKQTKFLRAKSLERSVVIYRRRFLRLANSLKCVDAIW